MNCVNPLFDGDAVLFSESPSRSFSAMAWRQFQAVSALRHVDPTGGGAVQRCLAALNRNQTELFAAGELARSRRALFTARRCSGARTVISHAAGWDNPSG